jgi:hypothetical protein
VRSKKARSERVRVDIPLDIVFWEVRLKVVVRGQTKGTDKEAQGGEMAQNRGIIRNTNCAAWRRSSTVDLNRLENIENFMYSVQESAFLPILSRRSL